MAKAKPWRTVRVVVELRTQEWNEEQLASYVDNLLTMNQRVSYNSELSEEPQGLPCDAFDERNGEWTMPKTKRWSRWWPAKRKEILEPWLRRGQEG